MNKRFMMVTYEWTRSGVNLSAWLCSVDFYASEKLKYPHTYFYQGDYCAWTVYCNTELTTQLVTALGSEADVECHKTEQRHRARKVEGRR